METAEQLKVTHRVHLIQLNGFAGSTVGENARGNVVAPFVEELSRYIDAAHIKSPAIIGHSLGGEAALMLAARHPASVGRVIVVDALPFYSLMLNPMATPESVGPQAAALRDAMLAASPAQVAAMQPAVIARLVKTRSQQPAIVAASLSSDRSVVARATYELMTTDVPSELFRVAAPVTVIYAYDANYGVPSEKIDALYRNAYAKLKGTQFARIDDSYHFVMLDQPARFRQAIDAALSVNR